MSRRGSAIGAGARHTAVALVVGVVAAVAAVPLLDTVRESREPDGFSALTDVPRDRVVEAVDALSEDGVWVAPDGRGLVDEQGEARIEAAVAAAEVPVFVVVWADRQENGVWSPDITSAILTGLADRLGVERGSLLMWQGPQVGETAEFGGSTYASVSSFDFVGDPGSTLPPMIEALGDPGEWYESDEFDYWGGVGGGIAAGALLSLAVMAGLGTLSLVLLAVLGRWPLPGRWRWSDEPTRRLRRPRGGEGG